MVIGPRGRAPSRPRDPIPSDIGPIQGEDILAAQGLRFLESVRAFNVS
ncbi:hypothetical protein BH23PLA1_BH23PLA1_45030 [soil metagenome]